MSQSHHHRLPRLSRTLFTALLGLSLLFTAPVHANEKDSFRIAWSIYVGWMPWGYGDVSGIVQKWADKYGIQIEVAQINDYIESINLYTAGSFDGVTVTNMDALTIPAASGVDTTALIIGDFSDGNDGVVLKGTDKLQAIKGRRVHLVELSVSHYLLARALESVGMSERDIRVVNTSDADIVAAFGTRNVNAVVTWNPQLGELRQRRDANVVFDSSQIPGEIIDTLAVSTATLQANPKFGKALTGAWYEIMAEMAAGKEAALQQMADAAGTDLAGFQAQLATTRMFYSATEATEFTLSPQLKQTMDRVRQFSFQHGLLGDSARNADFIGIELADGEVLGNPDNIRLRFTADYMRMAAEEQL